MLKNAYFGCGWPNPNTSNTRFGRKSCCGSPTYLNASVVRLSIGLEHERVFSLPHNPLSVESAHAFVKRVDIRIPPQDMDFLTTCTFAVFFVHLHTFFCAQHQGILVYKNAGTEVFVSVVLWNADTRVDFPFHKNVNL